MAKGGPRNQNAYLHDMLEAAELIRANMANASYDQFWANREKRDAVASHVSAATEGALPNVPFKALGGMRNPIAHDNGQGDFKIVWAGTQNDIEPLIGALRAHLRTA